MGRVWFLGKKAKLGNINVVDGAGWRSQGNASLEGSEGIFAAVTKLSGILASVPMGLYKNGIKVYDHPVARLLSYEAGPGVTPYLYKSMMETCRNVHGNAYALKVPKLNGELSHLEILEPEKVKPMRERESGDVYYELRPNNGNLFYVHYREMIHLRHVSAGGLAGVNPVDVLKGAIDYDRQMQTFSIRAARGVNTCVALEFPSNLGDVQQKQIIKNFKENYEQSNGDLIVLGGGVKANILNKSPVDTNVNAIEKITKSRIASVYNLPPHMLGLLENASYGSNEQQMLELLQLTMKSTFEQYTNEHELKLLTYDMKMQGYEIKFDEEKMIIPTRLQRAQEAQFFVRNGVKTIDEVREAMGLPPLTGGQGRQAMVSRDLAPLDYLMDSPDKVRRYGGRE